MANMAEEFQGGVSCGETWWNLSKNLFGLPSPCSLGANDVVNSDWPSHEMTNSKSSDGSTGFSSPDDWNQDFLHNNGRTGDDNSYSSMSYGGDSNFMITSFKQADGGYPLQQQPLNPISTSNGFPLNDISASYNSYTSSLLQTLFDTDNFDPPPQSTVDHNQPAMNNFSNFDQMNIPHDLIVPSFSSPRMDPPFARQQPTNTKTNHVKRVTEGVGDLGSTASKKSNNEPAMKRARIVTPSPLPTFKVRKEKLGDRVTALQQLVSPFGKTDTASVLHEAIEYIKFLHDQVSVLSTPYLKNGPPLQQNIQGGNKEGPTRDLKARGLCLVPISSTFPVTAETATDFWSPFFGDCFK